MCGVVPTLMSKGVSDQRIYNQLLFFKLPGMVDGSGKRAIEEMGSVEEGWAQRITQRFEFDTAWPHTLLVNARGKIKLRNNTTFYHPNVLLIIIKHIPYLGSENSFSLCEIEN